MTLDVGLSVLAVCSSYPLVSTPERHEDDHEQRNGSHDHRDNTTYECLFKPLTLVGHGHCPPQA